MITLKANLQDNLTFYTVPDSVAVAVPDAEIGHWVALAHLALQNGLAYTVKEFTHEYNLLYDSANEKIEEQDFSLDQVMLKVFPDGEVTIVFELDNGREEFWGVLTNVLSEED